MAIDSLFNNDKNKLNYLIETIHKKYDFDFTGLNKKSTIKDLVEHHTTCKNNITENSTFNSYHTDEHYIKHTTILEMLALIESHNYAVHVKDHSANIGDLKIRADSEDDARNKVINYYLVNYGGKADDFEYSVTDLGEGDVVAFPTKEKPIDMFRKTLEKFLDIIKRSSIQAKADGEIDALNRINKDIKDLTHVLATAKTVKDFDTMLDKTDLKEKKEFIAMLFVTMFGQDAWNELFYSSSANEAVVPFNKPEHPAATAISSKNPYSIAERLLGIASILPSGQPTANFYKMATKIFGDEVSRQLNRYFNPRDEDDYGSISDARMKADVAYYIERDLKAGNPATLMILKHIARIEDLASKVSNDLRNSTKTNEGTQEMKESKHDNVLYHAVLIDKDGKLRKQSLKTFTDREDAQDSVDRILKKQVQKGEEAKVVTKAELKKMMNESKKKTNEGTNMNEIEKAIMENMELDKAEVVLAVKNMSDDLQNVIEKISKMQVEDLLPIIERIKGEYGIDFAHNVEDSINGALDQAVESLKASKDSVDNQVLSLSGEVPENDMNNDEIGADLPDIDSEEPVSDNSDEDDGFGGVDSSMGMEGEPLGRARKESVENKKKKLIENTIDEAASRKDFRAIAALLKEIPDATKRKELAKHHAEIFAKQNPRFKKDLFMKAAGVLDENASCGATSAGGIASIPMPVGDFGPKKKKVIRRESTLDEAPRAYGYDKRNPKIDLYKKTGEYIGSTNWASTVKQAVEKYAKKHNIDPNSIRGIKDGVNKSIIKKESALDEAPSRKDFRAVAELLKQISDMTTRKELAKHHAEIFAKQNPRFKKDLFMKAAGVLDENVPAEHKMGDKGKHMVYNPTPFNRSEVNEEDDDIDVDSPEELGDSFINGNLSHVVNKIIGDISLLHDTYMYLVDVGHKDSADKLSRMVKNKRNESVSEAWNTEMHTSDADKGMFKNKTVAELKKMRSHLKGKKDHSAMDTKLLRQVNFALRAKHDFGTVESVQEQIKKLEGLIGNGTVVDPKDPRAKELANLYLRQENDEKKDKVTESTENLHVDGNYGNLTVKQVPAGLKFKINTTPEELQDLKDEYETKGWITIYDLFENFIGNSRFEFIAPERIGALTNNPYILADTEQNDHGEILDIHYLCYYNDYMLYDPMEKLLNGEVVLFHEHKE